MLNAFAHLTDKRYGTFSCTRSQIYMRKENLFHLISNDSYLPVHDFFNERWFSQTILCIHKAVAFTTYLKLGNWCLEYKMRA